MWVVMYTAQILSITGGSLDIGVRAYDNDENPAIRESFTIVWEDPATTSTGIPTTTTNTTTTPPVPLDPMIMAIAGVAAVIIVLIVVIVIKKR